MERERDVKRGRGRTHAGSDSRREPGVRSVVQKRKVIPSQLTKMRDLHQRTVCSSRIMSREVSRQARGVKMGSKTHQRKPNLRVRQQEFDPNQLNSDHDNSLLQRGVRSRSRGGAEKSQGTHFPFQPNSLAKPCDAPPGSSTCHVTTVEEHRGGETDQREGGEVRGCVGRRRRARGAFRAEKSGKAVRTDPTGIREWRVGVSKRAGEREGGLEGRGRENEGSATGQGGGGRGTAGRSKEGESLVEAGTSSNDDPRERVSEYEIQIGCGRT